MVLLNLKDQREIVQVIEYLVEIHQKNNTVEDVLKRFDLSVDEYRMCCNLAMPALAQGNMKGRFTAVRNMNRQMRHDLQLVYEAVKDEKSAGAEGVRKLYETYCPHRSNVVYGTMEDGTETE